MSEAMQTGKRPLERPVRLDSEGEGVENTATWPWLDSPVLFMCAPFIVSREFARRWLSLTKESCGPWTLGNGEWHFGATQLER